MIRVEKVLNDLFNGIQLDGLDSLKFGYGDEKELDAVIIGKINNRQQSYPLLWYVMPNELSNDGNITEGSFTFILAHNTKDEYYNDQRFDLVYETVLYPYIEEVLRLLGKSNRIMPSEDYRYTNYPNYSKEMKKHKQVSIWDAIELKIDLKINNGNNC